MSIRTVPLAVGKLHQLWDAVRAQVQAQGTDLTRYVRTWQLGDGSGPDLVDLADVSTDMLPLIRMETKAGGGEWRNEVTQKTVVTFFFTLALPGVDHGQAFDFWEAVVRRFYTQDRSFYGVCHQLGVVSFTNSLNGVNRTQFKDGQGQVVQGAIAMNFEFRTQY